MTETPAGPLPPPQTPPPLPRYGAAPTAATDDKVLVIVVYALHLAGFVTGGLTNIVGIIMSYVLRGNAQPWAQSHYDFQIRTFWIALVGVLIAIAVGIVSIPLIFILIGIPLLWLDGLFLTAITVWFVVRCVVGLIHAAESRPYPRPQAWLA